MNTTSGVDVLLRHGSQRMQRSSPLKFLGKLLRLSNWIYRSTSGVEVLLAMVASASFSTIVASACSTTTSSFYESSFQAGC